MAWRAGSTRREGKVESGGGGDRFGAQRTGEAETGVGAGAAFIYIVDYRALALVALCWGFALAFLALISVVLC